MCEFFILFDLGLTAQPDAHACAHGTVTSCYKPGQPMIGMPYAIPYSNQHVCYLLSIFFGSILQKVVPKGMASDHRAILVPTYDLC